MIDMLDNEAFMDELLTRLSLLTNPLNKEFNLPFAWDRLHGLTEETELVIRSEQKFAVYYDDEEHTACLVIRSREVEIEGIPREALILQAQGNNTISGRAILTKLPDLAWTDLRDWLTQMYRAGLLTHS